MLTATLETNGTIESILIDPDPYDFFTPMQGANIKAGYTYTIVSLTNHDKVFHLDWIRWSLCSVQDFHSLDFVRLQTLDMQFIDRVPANDAARYRWDIPGDLPRAPNYTIITSDSSGYLGISPYFAIDLPSTISSTSPTTDILGMAPATARTSSSPSITPSTPTPNPSKTPSTFSSSTTIASSLTTFSTTPQSRQTSTTTSFFSTTTPLTTVASTTSTPPAIYNSRNDIGAIIGATLGFLVLLIAAELFIVLRRLRQQKRRRHQTHSSELESRPAEVEGNPVVKITETRCEGQEVAAEPTVRDEIGVEKVYELASPSDKSSIREKRRDSSVFGEANIGVEGSSGGEVKENRNEIQEASTDFQARDEDEVAVHELAAPSDKGSIVLGWRDSTVLGEAETRDSVMAG